MPREELEDCGLEELYPQYAQGAMVEKPQFKVGDEVFVRSPYGYIIARGKITKIKRFAREMPFAREAVEKNYYEIAGSGLYAEDIVSRAGTAIPQTRMSTVLGSEGQTVQAGKYRLEIGKQVQVSPPEITKAQLTDALGKVPDVANTTEINYWVDIDNKLLYIEGWSDKCIAGWGYPKRSEEGAYETFFEVGERLTPEILHRKQKPSDNPFDERLKLLEGGWLGTPNAKRLFGITYGVYIKESRGNQ